MSDSFEEIEVAPQPVLFVSTTCSTGDIARTLAQILPTVRAFMEEKSIATTGLPFTRYTSWEGATCTLEAGYQTDDSEIGSDEIKSGHLPGGHVLTTLHVGSYDGLCEAYAAMEKRMAELGRKSGGHPWEVYVSSVEPDPESTQTRIFWPVR